MEQKQKKIREIILKYTNDSALKPQYDGMTAWELAGIILNAVEEKCIDCPNCGMCQLECDNCDYCGTSPKDAFSIA